MSEAPKKIWVEQDFRDWAVDPLDYAQGTKLTQYIRADIVEEMREALEYAAMLFLNEGNLSQHDEIESLLNRLEEE